MEPLRRALTYLKPYWHITVGAFVSLLVVTASSLVTPLLIGRIINQGIGQENVTLIAGLTLAILVVAVVRGLFTFVQG